MNDLISRKRVLKAIEKLHVYGFATLDEDKVIKTINELPSIAPKPKMGHWEQFGNSWEDKYKCSECGKEQPRILCGNHIIGHWTDFCPNCGAKMVEPQESEGKE